MICHGIPDMRELQDGDIVNIDVSTFYNGYHGDLNEVRQHLCSHFKLLHRGSILFMYLNEVHQLVPSALRGIHQGRPCVARRPLS